MKKRTVDMVIRVAIEVAEWLSVILKEKRKSQQNSKKRPSKTR